MYRIEKVLNNNSILASKDNQEVIFLGKGIGFGKKINDIYIPSDGVKKYKMETKEQEKRLPHEIIRNVDPVINALFKTLCAAIICCLFTIPFFIDYVNIFF